MSGVDMVLLGSVLFIVAVLIVPKSRRETPEEILERITGRRS